MNPIDILMHEHRLIEKVISALESFAARLESGGVAPRKDLADFAGFIREFADRCHHGKEEDILFKAMIEHGMSAEFGPIAVMLEEHVLGRKYAGALFALGSGSGAFTAKEAAEVGRAARGYGELLRNHIMKEDQILYPMAARLLPPPVMDGIARAFEAFERDEMGEGTHERFHATADRLIAAYR